MELGGPLSPEALGSLPTLPKVKAGTGLSCPKYHGFLHNSLAVLIINIFRTTPSSSLSYYKINV